MKAQLQLLRRLGAPAELVSSFLEVCEINSGLSEAQRVSFQELLEEQCREFGFHSVLPEGWFFRPFALQGPERRADIAVFGAAPEAPAIEQAYRRGFDQGFAECSDMTGTKPSARVEARMRELHQWRVRSVQQFGSSPGSDEKPPKKLFGGRAGISMRVRWQVLSRDSYKCVACGRSASNGVILEIDHKTPSSKGGLDDFENLQTLCFECNRGKGASV